MPSNTAAVDAQKTKGQSRLRNGNSLFLNADGRSKKARLFRGVLIERIERLGGDAVVSQWQRRTASRAAMAEVACADLESQFIGGERVDLELWSKLAGIQMRADSLLRLAERAKDAKPKGLREQMGLVK